MLTEPQIQRYSRHILLREVGGTGQEALLSACVRVPAMDAPGRACALWLARAGIGALNLPDDASPAPENDESGLLLAEDAGRPLSEAVRDRLRFHSPELRFDGSPGHTAQRTQNVPSALREALAIVRGIATRPSP